MDAARSGGGVGHTWWQNDARIRRADRDEIEEGSGAPAGRARPIVFMVVIDIMRGGALVDRLYIVFAISTN